MTERELVKLCEVEHLLAYATDGGHYCEEDGCTVETPKCREMSGAAALRKLMEVLDPPHVGLHPKRLSHTPERIYAEEWQRENERQPGINHGYTILEYILCPEGQKWPTRVSSRDAEVAACVIQWLGTNCGNCLIRKCEAEIERLRAERSSWGEYTAWNKELPHGAKSTAELLAERVKGTVSKEVHAILVREIGAALTITKKNALSELAKSITEKASA